MKKLLLVATLVLSFVFAQAQNPAFDNYLAHLGDTVVVSGQIFTASFLQNIITKPTFLNLGDEVPKHRLMIRIEPGDRSKFPAPPEEYFFHKNVTITGRLEDYKGSPLIKLTDPSMIQIGEDSPPRDTFAGVYMRSNLTGTITPENKIADSAKPIEVAKTLVPVKPDTIAEKKWIVPTKDTAAERLKEDVRILEKDFTLRTAPYKDAPVIAELHEGMRVTILSHKDKWTYINVSSVDGTNHVSGYIKNKKFKGMRKG